jgi:predicted benzoate:H+ symporter BenE
MFLFTIDESFFNLTLPFFFLEALLKRQGLNVKGLMKAAPAKEEPQPYIDCTGRLQVYSAPFGS